MIGVILIRMPFGWVCEDVALDSPVFSIIPDNVIAIVPLPDSSPLVSEIPFYVVGNGGLGGPDDGWNGT